MRCKGYEMDAAAKSLMVYGVYLLANGVALLLAPDVVLKGFGLPATSDPWIRVLGLVAGEIGYYFVVIARRGVTSLYPATVLARGVAALVFVALVASGI